MHFVDILEINASTKHVQTPSLAEVQQTVRKRQQNNLRFLQGTVTLVYINENFLLL